MSKVEIALNKEQAKLAIVSINERKAVLYEIVQSSKSESAVGLAKNEWMQLNFAGQQIAAAVVALEGN